MNHIQRIFGKSRVLLPVIHVHSGDHAEHNARVALENGADGVWLINQGSTVSVVLQAARDIIKLHPTWWVGVNLLGKDDLETLEGFKQLPQLRNIRGLWSDDAGVSPKTSWSKALGRKDAIISAKGSWGFTGLYFAGAAFKYRTPVPREQWGYVAVMAAASGVDVVTTSGEATGSAAPSEKLAIMREALGEDHALALASGVSEENIGEYPMVNAFIVASSLLRPGMGDNFDPTKMRRLADLI